MNTGAQSEKFQGESLKRATEAYARRDFSSALRIASSIIDRDPDSPDGVAARCLRAQAYEFGNSPDGNINDQQALLDYCYLADKDDYAKFVGHTGSARVLSSLGMKDNRDDIVRNAEQAIAMDSHIPSVVLLGYIYREIDKNISKARQYFYRAFKEGDFIGGRLWVATVFLEQGFSRGLLATIRFLLKAPFLKRRELAFYD